VEWARERSELLSADGAKGDRRDVMMDGMRKKFYDVDDDQGPEIDR